MSHLSPVYLVSTAADTRSPAARARVRPRVRSRGTRGRRRAGTGTPAAEVAPPLQLVTSPHTAQLSRQQRTQRGLPGPRPRPRAPRTPSRCRGRAEPRAAAGRRRAAELSPRDLATSQQLRHCRRLIFTDFIAHLHGDVLLVRLGEPRLGTSAEEGGHQQYGLSHIWNQNTSTEILRSAGR